jgi:hypothetical protein
MLTFGCESRTETQTIKKISESTEIKIFRKLEIRAVKLNMCTNALITEEQNIITTFMEWKITD